jgi:hypothetical protein
MDLLSISWLDFRVKAPGFRSYAERPQASKAIETLDSDLGVFVPAARSFTCLMFLMNGDLKNSYMH